MTRNTKPFGEEVVVHSHVHKMAGAPMRPFTDLPEFDAPPVVELVLSVVFESIPLSSAYVGLFWASVIDRFPRTEDQAPVEQLIEVAKGRTPIRPGLQLEFLEGPPKPRVWLVDASGNELLQIQHDRVSRNWRRNDTDATYPRYETVRQAFTRDFQAFEQFVTAKALGRLKIVQCEVTYVNHIFPNEVWSSHGQAANVFPILQHPAPGSFLSSPEDIRFSSRYVIHDPQGDFVGRLNIASQGAFRLSDDTPLMILNLTARGRPMGDGFEGALRFLDTGHEWIVRGFVDVTSSLMHKAWGRTR